ncbi:hypothetical protein AACH10_21460 [Ideonella sp. DXS22W]|uniref:Right-handed parallel beta-helix repeat-containing protein n=1 Tax=Pseudaquabacterium inlustre TaxID=2984192 RepID=A0ABU9CMI8_9BURK
MTARLITPSLRLQTLATAVLLVGGAALAQPAGGPPMPNGQPLGAVPGQPPGAPQGMPPPPPSEPVTLRAALVLNDASTLPAGRTLRVTEDGQGGLIVAGRSKLQAERLKVEVLGRGKSDFDGVAAGVLVKDGSTLTLRDARITTRGVVAAAVTATGESTLRVQRSTLVAEGGPLPSGYVRRIGPGMMEPPTPLGITGTARTTLVLGSAKAFYEDSRIVADGWGALSTDAARGATLQVDRCQVLVRRSGYGTYADNGAAVVINDSTLDVPTFGGVIAGQASLALNRVSSRSGGNTVMIHNVMGRPDEMATLRLTGGRLTSTNAAIVVKSANADIVLDGTRLEAKNGDLLLAVVNDDSHRTPLNGTTAPGSRAVLRRARLNGNLLNLDAERRLNVALEATQLRGRVHDVALSLDAASRWTATADSRVLLAGPMTLAQLDAPRGVSIRARVQGAALPPGRHTLAGGGVLEVEAGAP